MIKSSFLFGEETWSKTERRQSRLEAITMNALMHREKTTNLVWRHTTFEQFTDTGVSFLVTTTRTPLKGNELKHLGP